jgi:hypothetical protein
MAAIVLLIFITINLLYCHKKDTCLLYDYPEETLRGLLSKFRISDLRERDERIGSTKPLKVKKVHGEFAKEQGSGLKS